MRLWLPRSARKQVLRCFCNEEFALPEQREAAHAHFAQCARKHREELMHVAEQREADPILSVWDVEQHEFAKAQREGEKERPTFGRRRKRRGGLNP